MWCSLGWLRCCVCLCSSPEQIYIVLFWGDCEKGGSDKCRVNSLHLIWLFCSLEQADGILESLWEKLVSPEEGLNTTQIRDEQRPNLLLQML